MTTVRSALTAVRRVTTDIAELQLNVWTVPFMGDAEFPNPALAVVDLRSVVCCALCAVTCAACWACNVCQGIEPPRLPPARQE